MEELCVLSHMQTTDTVDCYHQTQDILLPHTHYVTAQKPWLDEFLEPIDGDRMQWPIVNYIYISYIHLHLLYKYI